VRLGCHCERSSLPRTPAQVACPRDSCIGVARFLCPRDSCIGVSVLSPSSIATNMAPLPARRMSAAVMASPLLASTSRSSMLRTLAPRVSLPLSMCSAPLSSHAPFVDVASLPSAGMLFDLMMNCDLNRAVTSNTNCSHVGAPSLPGTNGTTIKRR
jgi:hypothetical protein